MLATTGFFTAGVWTPKDLVTYNVLIFIRLATREVHRAGTTPLNAFSERWLRTLKEECVERIILVGERSLRYALEIVIAHVHEERNPQGLETRIPFPASVSHLGSRIGPVGCRERLGGLLKSYLRSAACVSPRYRKPPDFDRGPAFLHSSRA